MLYMVFPLFNNDEEFSYQGGFGFPNLGIVELSMAAFEDIKLMNEIAINKSIPIICFETDNIKRLIAFDETENQSLLSAKPVISYTVLNPVDFDDNEHTISFYNATDIQLDKIKSNAKTGVPLIKVSGQSFSIGAKLESTGDFFTSPNKPLKNFPVELLDRHLH